MTLATMTNPLGPVVVSRLATQPARASGKFAIGGDLTSVRLGSGAMQIPGSGVWGEPRDHDEVIRVLRRALEPEVTLIDTADSYGPEVSERLIREALHPYPDDLVLATKAGRIDPNVPLVDQLGALVELQAEGKLGRIGLSEVSVPEIQAARAITSIATVQDRYNLADRRAEPVLDHCERESIGFIMVPDGRRPPGPTRRTAATDRRRARRHARSTRAGVAAAALTRSAVDPRPFNGRPPRRKRGCRPDQAHPRTGQPTRDSDLMARNADRQARTEPSPSRSISARSHPPDTQRHPINRPARTSAK